MAHKLVKNNGIIAFDDYLWSPEENGKQNYYHLVKPAVDAYVNIYQQKLTTCFTNVANLSTLYTKTIRLTN